MTGLLFVEPSQRDFHEINQLPEQPLANVPFEKLSPGAKALEKVIARYR